MKEQYLNALAWLTDKANEAYKYSLLIVAFGSTLVIYKYVFSKADEIGVPMLIAGVAALIAANVWYRGIEHTLKVVMPYTAMYLLATDKQVKDADIGGSWKKIGRMSIGATLVLSIATLSLSLLINPEIAESMTKEQDSSHDKAYAETITQSYDNTRQTLQDAYNAALLADKESKKDAQRQSDEILVNAAKSKGPELYRLWAQQRIPGKPGYNKWCRGEKQLGPALRKARKEGERILANVVNNATAPAALQALNNYIASASASKDTVTLAVAGLVVDRSNQYIDKISRRNWQLFSVVIIGFAVAVLSCFLMVSGRLERGEQVIDDESPGMGKVAKKAISSWNKRLAEKYADKWKVKFVAAAAPSGVPVSAPVATTKTTPPSSRKSVATPVATPPKKATSKTDKRLSVNLRKTDRSVSVEVDGKLLSAKQAQDRARKYYDRSKTAKTERGRTDNDAKYRQMKDVMEPYFYFKETAKTVSVTQK